MNADIIFRGNATSVDRASSQAVHGMQRVERGAKTTGSQIATATVHTDKLSHSLKHLATLSIGALGLHELVHGLKEAVNAAGDVEKQQSKVVRVFGETPRVLEAFERSSAKAYGISHLAALKAATSTGALLTNLGIGPKLAAGLSVGIQKLSADMGSFNDVPTASVVQKVNNALLGQTRGLKALGISLSDADVRAKAFSIGLVKPAKNADDLRAASDRVTVAENKWVIAVQKHGKESKEALSAEASLIGARKAQAKATEGVVPPLTAGQKALATYALLLERSKVQQGDFARNQDKLANSSKVLDAEFADLSDRVGNAVEPAVKSLIEFMAGPGLSGANAFLTGFGRDAQQLFHAVEPLGPAGEAAAQGLGAIANVPGLVPGVVGATLAYQGYTRAVGAGAAIISSGRGLLGSLVGPFRSVELGAEAATATYSGFGGQVRGTTGSAAKGISPLKAFATSTTGVGVAAGIAVGTLIALSSAEESVSDKARAAASDLLTLQDAQAGFKGSKIEATRTGLSQGQAARDLINANQALAGAKQRAAGDFPDTVKGHRAEAAALAEVTTRTRAAAVAQNTYDAAHQAHVNAEQQVVKARDAVAASTDRAIGKIVDLQKTNEELARIAVTRGIPAAKVSAAVEEKRTAAFGRTTAAISKQIKANQEIRPKSAAGFQAILDFIKQAGRIPEKKTLTILLNDAASGKLAAVKRELDSITNKTVTLAISQANHPFARTNPINPTKPVDAKAAGDVISRPQLAMVGEEAPAWPEFIVPTNPARRNRAMSLIGQMRSWIPGFAGGAGPPVPPGLAAREAALLKAAKPLPASKSAKAAAAKQAADKRPGWLKHWQDDLGSKLPGDDAFSNAIARAEANLADAGRTAPKSDDVQALHMLIKLARGRAGELHGPKLRGAHKEAVWQTAVNSEISSVSGQLTGYQSSLRDLVKKPTVDEIQLNVPGSIRWAIEKAGLTASPDDDIVAQRSKRAWLQKELKKAKKGSPRRTALQRELARTDAELSTLRATKADAAQTPPEVPLSVQEALADASLTPDTGDDLAALAREQQFLQGAIATEQDPTARIALKQALAGVNSEIADLQGGGAATNPDGTPVNAGPTDDDRAILAQTQRRLDIATRSASLSEAELAVFKGSGDIGSGRFGNTLGAGAGPAMLITLGDGRSLSAIAGAAVAGMGAQASIPANRETVGIR